MKRLTELLMKNIILSTFSHEITEIIYGVKKGTKLARNIFRCLNILELLKAFMTLLTQRAPGSKGIAFSSMCIAPFQKSS